MKYQKMVWLVVCLLLLVGCAENITPESENKKGLSYYESADYEKACEYFERAISLGGESAEYRINYGMALIQEKRFLEAVEQFEAAFTAGETSVERELNKCAHRGEGIAYMQMQQFEKALACFNSALEIKEEPGYDVDILYYKANTLECLGYLESAIDTYSEVLEKDKKNNLAYAARANLYRQKGEYKKAITDYETALELSEGDYRVYVGLYSCYMEMGESERAAQILYDATLLEIKNNEDKYLLGMIHFYQGNDTSAKIEMENAVDNGYEEAYYFLGEIAFRAGEYAEAAEYYETYRDVMLAESPTLCNQLAICYLALGDYDRAEECIEIGLAYGNSNSYQQLRRNEVAFLEEKGELRAAYEKIQEYIVDYPDDTEATTEYRFLKKLLFGEGT